MTTDELRALVAQHGRLQSQAVAEWQGPFPLPTALEVFYRDVGPHDVMIASYGDPYFLPRLGHLWAFQALYRYESAGQRLDNWDDDWLAVADLGGYPFVFSRSSGKIAFAIRDLGSWNSRELFPDIRAMAACLSLLGNVVAAAGKLLTDEECRLLPSHRATARHQLAGVLGSFVLADEVLASLGWG